MMPWDPRKRIWSMAVSGQPRPAAPWIRRALTVSRTAFRTCRAIVSLASLIGLQVPVADERRNRDRRHAHTPRPPGAVATRAIADGSGVIIVHAAFVSIQSRVPDGANENIAIPTPRNRTRRDRSQKMVRRW